MRVLFLLGLLLLLFCAASTTVTAQQQAAAQILVARLDGAPFTTGGFSPASC